MHHFVDLDVRGWLQLQACARRRVDTIIVGQHQEGVKVYKIIYCCRVKMFLNILFVFGLHA